MGCKQSSVVTPNPSTLIEDQPQDVKHRLATAIKRDDPIIFQYIIKTNQVSLEEKLNDDFDTNWTILHHAAAKNASKIIEKFLAAILSAGQLPFDIINALDLAEKSPIQTAYDYSCFEAFQAIILTCDKYHQGLELKGNFLKSIEKDSPYMRLIKAFKNNTIQSQEDPSNHVDDVKEDGEYITFVNRGSFEQAFTEREKHVKGHNRFKDKEVWQNGISADTKPEEVEKSNWKVLKDVVNSSFQVLKKGGFSPNTEVTSINPNLSFVFCALNEYPSYLNNVFYSLDPSEKGIFSLVLYKNGEPNYISLDEYFPCNIIDGKDKLRFQAPFGDEVWPLIIEKGLAKLYGNYASIASLSLSELLETILGAPVRGMKVSDCSADLFWMTLQDIDSANYLTFFESKEIKDLYFFMAGIFSANEKRIVKLRACRPGAKVIDELPDSALDEETRPIVGYETNADGFYYLEVKDFVKQFENVLVCYYKPNWHRTAMTPKNLGIKAENFIFDTKESTNLYLSFLQANRDGNSIYPLHFVLIRKEGSKVTTLSEGDHNCKSGAKICYISEEGNVNLEPGTYLIQVKVMAKSSKSICQGTLIAYSNKPLTFKPVENKKVLEEVFVSLGESNDMKEPCGAGCEFTSGWWSIYYWLYFENKSNKKWEIEVSFGNLTNLKVGKLFQTGPHTLKVVVEKGQKKVGYLLKKDPAEPGDFKLDMNHNFE